MRQKGIKVKDFINSENWRTTLDTLRKCDLLCVTDNLGLNFTSQNKKEEIKKEIIKFLDPNWTGLASGSEEDTSASMDVAGMSSSNELEVWKLKIELKRLENESKKLENENKKMQLELAMLGTGSRDDDNSLRNDNFDFSKNIKLVPKFDESDLQISSFHLRR